MKECKNNTFMKWLCWMLLQKGLDMTGVMMSRVGHTHNSLGILVDFNAVTFFCKIWVCVKHVMFVSHCCTKTKFMA